MKKVLIASHRGRFGGNIVENTPEAFDAALNCGADIVETDLHKTKDGVIVLYHDSTPKRLLGLEDRPIGEFTLEELQKPSLLNVIGSESGYHVQTLEAFLAHMKGRDCLINLDQCWTFCDEVYAQLAKFGMEEQALIKGRAPYDEVVEWLSRYDFRPQFIPIITCDEEIEAFNSLPKEVRIPTVEVFFREESAAVIGEAFRKQLCERGIGLWVNSLDLNIHQDMCAMHNDTVSMVKGADEGWGWLIDHGVTTIQTDWPAELREYLEKRGCR